MNYLKNLSSEDDRTQAEAWVLEYFDWGSQSIAQSKFQRTVPTEGKDFQENIRVFLRQYFFGKNRKNVGRNENFSWPLEPRPRVWREALIEGIAEHANGIF